MRKVFWQCSPKKHKEFGIKLYRLCDMSEIGLIVFEGWVFVPVDLEQEFFHVTHA
jgi:hypothetical protein